MAEPLSPVESIILDSLNRLETKSDTIAAKMDQKADKSDIQALNIRLDGHEKRIERTEGAIRDKDVQGKTQQQEETTRKDKRQSRINMIVAIVSCLALIASVVFGVVVH